MRVKIIMQGIIFFLIPVIITLTVIFFLFFVNNKKNIVNVFYGLLRYCTDKS